MSAPPPASPPARRPAASTWRDPRLAVGLVIVAICAVLGAKLLGAADDTVAVWAVRGPVSGGSTLGPGDLVRRDVGFADAEDADRYLSAEADLPAGARLSRDIGAGELLPRAALGGADGPPLVEVPLSVDSASVPATVRAGSVVDVWVARKVAAGLRQPAAELLFDDVPVVSAPRAASSLGPSSTRQVIVGVGSADTSDMPHSLAALVSGTVILTQQG